MKVAMPDKLKNALLVALYVAEIAITGFLFAVPARLLSRILDECCGVPRDLTNPLVVAISLMFACGAFAMMPFGLWSRSRGKR